MVPSLLEPAVPELAPSSTLVVYVDDAEHARALLATLAAADTAHATRWLLVACAPRITHRANPRASHRAREHWRNQWADRLFAQLLPHVPAPQAAVTPLLARQPLPELLAQLQQVHGPLQVLDARRPKGQGPGARERGGMSALYAGFLGGMSSLLGVCCGEALA